MEPETSVSMQMTIMRKEERGRGMPGGRKGGREGGRKSE